MSESFNNLLIGGPMSESSNNLLHEQVAKLAYEIWERNGRPTGTAKSDWLLADNSSNSGIQKNRRSGHSLWRRSHSEEVRSQTTRNASDPRSD